MRSASNSQIGRDAISQQLPKLFELVKSYVSEMGVGDLFFQQMMNTDPAALIRYRNDEFKTLFPGTDPVYDEERMELGYVEGRNIRFEYRWAEGKFDRLSELAADLIRLKVDVIVAFVTQASEVAKNQTSTIPIVMVGVGDPVGAGLAPSLARPGGNVTAGPRACR
jgi:hypothetical protein